MNTSLMGVLWGVCCVLYETTVKVTFLTDDTQRIFSREMFSFGDK